MGQRKKINNNPQYLMGAYKMPLDLCDEIVSEFAKIDHLKDYTETHRGYFSHYNLFFNYKNEDLSVKFINFMNKCIKKYIKKFKYVDVCDEWNFQGKVQVQRYPPGKHYSLPHSEIDYVYPRIKRHLVFMTYLNDIKNGGGTKFLHQKLTIKPKKGFTLIWPAGWTHTHIGIPAKNEVKYIITGWYEYVKDYEFFKSAEDWLLSKKGLEDFTITVNKK